MLEERGEVSLGLIESAKIVVRAKIAVTRVAKGGLAGAARGKRHTGAALRIAQGRPALPGRPRKAGVVYEAVLS